MPGKAGHSRGKPHQSRKSKAKQRHASMAASPPVAEAPRPAAVDSVPAPAPSVPVLPKPSGGVPYPHVRAELRRIGILAGIIIVVLIVLALVLS